MPFESRYAKAIVAILAAAAVAAAEALPEYAGLIQIVIAVLGALGVYLTPNKTA